jgi:hypothetical protein
MLICFFSVLSKGYSGDLITVTILQLDKRADPLRSVILSWQGHAE